MPGCVSRSTSRTSVTSPIPERWRRSPLRPSRRAGTHCSSGIGRVIFCAGLGGPVEDEFGSFGDTTDPVVLAERLDEGLELLRRYWSGERVNHHGRHYH